VENVESVTKKELAIVSIDKQKVSISKNLSTDIHFEYVESVTKKELSLSFSTSSTETKKAHVENINIINILFINVLEKIPRFPRVPRWNKYNPVNFSDRDRNAVWIIVGLERKHEFA